MELENALREGWRDIAFLDTALRESPHDPPEERREYRDMIACTLPRIHVARPGCGYC